MDNIKLSLSISLPGRVMYSKEESLKQLSKPAKNKQGKVIKKKGKIVYNTQLVPDFAKNDSLFLNLKDGSTTKEFQVFVRKSKPAKQVINLTEEAYENMLSKVPPVEFKGVWNGLSDNQKIHWHCSRIAESLGGTLINFEVLD